MESSTTRARIGIEEAGAGAGGSHTSPGLHDNKPVRSQQDEKRVSWLQSSLPRRAVQKSSRVRSSIFMSLNSLDSKISPHSLHSTNSASSSRLTICTRGCLQGCCAAALCGAEGDFDVINPGMPRQNLGGGQIRGSFRPLLER